MALRHLRVSRNGQIFQGPLIYYGGYLRAGAGGAGTVDVFDGQGNDDAFLDGYRAAANEHDQHQIDLGILVLRGLFVDIGANVDQFIVYYDTDISPAELGPTGQV